MSHKEATIEQAQSSGNYNITDQELGKKHVDADNIGVDALIGVVEDVDLGGSEARKVLHKIDTYLLPLLCVTYLIQVRTATSLNPRNREWFPADVNTRSFWISLASLTQHYGA